jgi:hypothetical protein
VYRAQVLKYLERRCWIYVRKQGPTQSKIKNDGKIMPCLKWSKTMSNEGASIQPLRVLKQVLWRLTHMSSKAPNPRPPNNNTQIWVITCIKSVSLVRYGVGMNGWWLTNWHHPLGWDRMIRTSLFLRKQFGSKSCTVVYNNTYFSRVTDPLA